ncbi:CLUMA_CG019375, isoform A [Clunio marinus]|uniref:CLUMA_CG019375, isoform A n=1 Tax=Clunio marinus TaxID=568069 RepID=A0A1J1J5H5_9DIPT|nr:CLUMA_CG019375, isoform A [Clunio marinus]
MPENFFLRRFSREKTHFAQPTTILIMAILRAKAVEAHYASCCVMVFHVVGFSCFSLKIGEMEIFHKTSKL